MSLQINPKTSAELRAIDLNFLCFALDFSDVHLQEPPVLSWFLTMTNVITTSPHSANTGSSLLKRLQHLFAGDDTISKSSPTLARG